MKKFITAIFCTVFLAFSGSLWTMGDYYDINYINDPFELIRNYKNNIYFEFNYGLEERNNIDFSLKSINDIYEYLYCKSLDVNSPYINKIIFISTDWFNYFLNQDEGVLRASKNLIFISESDYEDEHMTYNIVINLDMFGVDKIKRAKSCINAAEKFHAVIENRL